MDKETMEKEIADLKAKLEQATNPRQSIADKIEIPEELTPESFREALKTLETEMLKEMQETVRNQESQRKEQAESKQKETAEKEFNDAVAKFKESHPDLFTDENKSWLDQTQYYLNIHTAEGKSTAEALELAYKDLTEKTKYEAPESEETTSSSEESSTSVLPTGSLSSTTKVADAEVETKGAKTEGEAVKSAMESLRAEGLTFPATT